MDADRQVALGEAMPGLVAELVAALIAGDEPELAQQVRSLRVVSRCGCGDSSCSSFYTGPKPAHAWSAEGTHRCCPLIVERGMVTLDVVDGIIRYVEVVDRPDIAAMLDDLERPQPRRTGEPGGV